MSPAPRHFPAPKPGDIVWCRFPEDKTLRPAPKSRPALIWRTGRICGETTVAIAYGTSKKIERLFPWEFAVTVPPGAPFRQQPKPGVLHPSLMRRAQVAFQTIGSK